MTDRDDKALQEWLGGESPVSRAYGGLPEVQPPPELDQRILAAAHAAARSDTPASDKVTVLRRWRRWSVSAALAASVVIGVPLAVHVYFSPSAPTLHADRNADEMETHDFIRVRPGDTGRDVPCCSETEVELPPKPERPAKPAPPPVLARELREQAAAPEPGDLAQRRGPTEVAAVATVRPDRDEAIAAARAEQDATVAASPDTFAAEAGDGDTSARAPARRAARRESAMADARADNHQSAAPPGLAEAVAAGADAAHAEESKTPVSRWLERIEQLAAAGDVDAARRELGELLRRHPGQPLPAGFPIAPAEATYPDVTVARTASWLDAIARLVNDGREDAARQELARFFDRYPEHRLPPGFPLTHEDAATIER